MKYILLIILLINSFLLFNLLNERKVEIYEVVQIIKPISDREIVEKNLNVNLNKYKRTWTKKQKEEFIQAILIGYETYSIHPRIVLSIIEIESNYKIKAYNKNKNKTLDYGLSQINEDNWDWLSAKSKKVLEENNIKHSDNKYNISLNVMNCFSYLDWSKNTLSKKGYFTYEKLIQSYNVGVNGSLSNKEKYNRLRKKYFNKFIVSYNNLHF